MEKYTNYAFELRRALKSQPINTTFLINLAKQTDNLERQFIRESYFNLTKIDLIEDLKSLRDIEGFGFEYLMIGLYRSPTEYDVYEIFEAVDGVGTNEDTLSEIIGTRDPYRIQEINKFYSLLFSSELKDVLIAEQLEKDYLKFLNFILFPEKNTSNSNENSNSNSLSLQDRYIEASLSQLNNFGGKLMEKKLAILSDILIKENNSMFLKELNESYKIKNNRSLNDLIEKEFKNPLKTLLNYTLNGHSDFLRFYAERLINAFNNAKNDSKRIIRSLISIYPVNMTEFRNVMSTDFKIDLDDLITRNTQGLFRDLLLVVANGDNFPKNEIPFRIEIESI
jgi:annexin A7/11